eukprot:1740348-Prorocentrum_lima.AAC.1
MMVSWAEELPGPVKARIAAVLVGARLMGRPIKWKVVHILIMSISRDSGRGGPVGEGEWATRVILQELRSEVRATPVKRAHKKGEED